MKNWSRRELLKVASLAPAAAKIIGLPSGESARAATLPKSRVDANSLSPRERLSLDFNWRFHFGHASDPAKDFYFGGGDGGAFAKTAELFQPAREKFDDSDWHAVDLPHDFAVGLPFINDEDLYQFGFKPIGRKYPETSIGWYRRVFEIPQSDLGRRISLEFDGVFRDAIVVLNGIYLGRNLSGYAPFRFDIANFVNYGGRNVLVVRADATEHEGWFYEGAGIYRHVWLTKTNAVHVADGGVCVRSDVSDNVAQVCVATEVANDSDTGPLFLVSQTILDPVGKEVAGDESGSGVYPWDTQRITQTMPIRNPLLWSPENPRLYRVITTIKLGDAEMVGPVVDRCETTFGIRTMRFDADKGFFLNGERVEIKGTCNHQDHAGVGSALPDRLQYVRIAKLKEMGANAYRTSHNPPTPELLDACDELGMLVMDETRMFSSSPEGLSQLERMVRRDRNHPCIFIWSLGNEEPLQGTNAGARIAATMKRLVRRLDPGRPVTLAMNGSWGKGASGVVDVQGWNYFRLGDEDKFHATFPQKPLVGSEDASALSTRGIYANDPARGYMSAYDVNKPYWGSLAHEWWNFYSARPFAAGAFAWTGFDYRGEPTPYKWPCISSHFGIMDTCGFPKDTYFYYQAWWTDKVVVHLFPHWNWPGKEGQFISVWVHSNCDEVELLLNGASLGRKSMTRRGHLEWQVNYAPGTLLARGYEKGRVAAQDWQKTTGPATAIRLMPDRLSIIADSRDVSVITVATLDADGRVVPTADNEITFEIDGPAKIVGVGNGNPSSHEADRPPSELYDEHGKLLFGAISGGSRGGANAPEVLPSRRCFNGLAQVIVQSQRTTGSIRVTVHSPGLKSATIQLQCIASKTALALID